MIIISGGAAPLAAAASAWQGFSWRATEPLGPVNDERELLRKASACDPGAFTALYKRYADVVYGICRRILKDPAAAEDVTQSVFTMFWTRPNAFRGGSFSAWIARVARNAALDVVRSAAVRTRDWELPPDLPAFGDVEDEVACKVDAQAIAAALGALPREQREAIEHAYFGGLSYREVAQRSGIPLGTVKTRIRSGLRQLWDALQRQVTV